MKTRSKYYPLLLALLRRPSFKALDANRLGVSSRVLAYFVKQGILEHLGSGVYRSTSYESEIHPSFEDVVIAEMTVPNAVICLISALKYYELTEEIPRENWIAIPNAQYAPKRPLLRVVRMRNTRLGQKTVSIGGQKVKIFDRERCIIDAFRYLTKEVAIKALREYLRSSGGKPNLNQLEKYAKILRVNIKDYILSLTI